MTKDSLEYIDKPFNVRPLILWAVVVGLTVYMSHVSAEHGWWIVVLWLAVVLGVVVLLNFLYKRNDKVLGFLGTNKIFFFVSVVLMLLVILSFTVTNAAYTHQRQFYGVGEIQGTVRAHRLDNSGDGSVTLANVTFNGESVRGRVRINVRNLDATSIDNIAFGAVVQTNTSLRTSNASSFNVNNRIRYNASINGVSIDFMQNATDLRSIVLRYSYNFFHIFMSDNSADLIYSMMFGDRSTLDDELQQDFRLTGLAHVLAVSGMHVGLIVVILMASLKFLPLNKRWQFLILVLCIGFYAFLADFRISIVRSSIMFLVLAGNRLLVRRADFLSSICLSFIAVLILFPYSIQALSFQLSFGCMFGIALFYKPISTRLQRWIIVPKSFEKFKNWIVAAVTMYFSTSLVTFPFFIRTFGFYPVVSVFANLLLLPIMVLAFQMAVIALVTYVGFPLLYVADIMIRFVLNISHSLANASWAQISVSLEGMWMWFYFFGLVLMSRFVFIKNKYRYPIAVFMISIFAGIILIQNLF